MRRFLVVPVAGILIVASACNSIPVYDHAKACSLDAAVAEGLLESDRFTADAPELVPSPVGNGADGSILCSVDRGENKILIQARAYPRADIEIERAKAEAEESRYEYRGGFGYIRDDAIVWTCGVVHARMSIRELPDTTIEWRKVAEPIWDRLGCRSIDADGKAYQPDEWQ